MPEPTLDLLTADGEALRRWFDKRDCEQRDNRAVFVQMRDAIVAAARSAPVGELTDAMVAEAWNTTVARDAGLWADAGYDDNLSRAMEFARVVSRPSDAVLAEARREGWDAARDYWQRHPRSVREPLSFVAFDAERDRLFAPPAKPTPPSVTLSDGSVVRLMDLGGFVDREDASGKRIGSIRALHGVEDAVTELLTDKDTRGDEKAVRGLFAALASTLAPGKGET